MTMWLFSTEPDKWKKDFTGNSALSEPRSGSSSDAWLAYLLLIWAGMSLSPPAAWPQFADLIIQEGHTAQIQQLAAAANGTVLVSSAEDDTIRVWDVASRMLSRVFTLQAVRRVALSADGSILGTLREEGPDLLPILELWDSRNGVLRATPIGINFLPSSIGPQFGEVRGLAFDPKGVACAVVVHWQSPLDASVKAENSIRLFDSSTGGEISRRVVSESLEDLQALTFAPDGQSLLAVAQGKILQCPVKGGASRVIGGLTKDLPEVEAFVVNDAGDLMATLESESPVARDGLSVDGSTESVRQLISIWRVGTKKPLRQIKPGVVVYDLCFDPSSQHILAATAQGLVGWSVSDGQRLAGFGLKHDSPMVSLARLPGAIAVAERQGRISWRWPATGRWLTRFDRAENFVSKLLFTADNRRLLVQRGTELLEWNLAGGEVTPVWSEKSTWDWVSSTEGSGVVAVHDLTVDGDGREVLLLERKRSKSAAEGGISLVLRQGKEERSLPGPATTASPLAQAGGSRLSADGRFAFVRAGGSDPSNWRAYETSLLEPAGAFRLSELIAEDHSPGKVCTLIGTTDRSAGREFAALDAVSGGAFWKLKFPWSRVIRDPLCRFLVYVDDRSGRLLSLNLQSTNAPSLIAVPEFANQPRLGLEGEFTIRGDAAVLEANFEALRFRFDLRTGARVSATAPDTTNSPVVTTATLFGPGSPTARASRTEWVATALPDGSIELKSSKAALTRLVLGGVTDGRQEYLVLSADGHYAASPGGCALAGLRTGGAVLPFDQFDLELNRPDLVLESFGAEPAEVEAYRQLHQWRLRRAGVIDQLVKGSGVTPAEVELDSKVLPVATLDQALNLRVRVRSGGRLVRALVISVNDKLISDGAGISLALAPGLTAATNVSLALSYGQNVIDFWAVDDGGSPSRHRRVIVTRTSPPQNRTLYVLAVGVGEYQDRSVAALRFAAKDAQDLEHFWLRQGRFAGHGRPANWTQRDEQHGFDAIKTLILTNAAATRAALRRLDNFVARAGVDDRVLIHLAGHGVRDAQGDFYFAPHDMDFAQPSTRGFSDADIERLLARSGARENMLFIDSCQAGELDPEPGVALNAAAGVASTTKSNRRGVGEVRGGDSGGRVRLEDVFRDLRAGTGAAVIAASGATEAAFEGEPWRNGVFTYALLSGLESGRADLNRDTTVRFSELRRYVEREVTRLTSGKQQPSVRHDPPAYDFTVMKYATALPDAFPSPNEVP